MLPTDLPETLPEFLTRFGTDEACRVLTSEVPARSDPEQPGCPGITGGTFPRAVQGLRQLLCGRQMQTSQCEEQVFQRVGVQGFWLCLRADYGDCGSKTAVTSWRYASPPTKAPAHDPALIPIMRNCGPVRTVEIAKLRHDLASRLRPLLGC